MLKNNKILAIIPARGGSKRLPGKNIRPIAGKPLIAHSIDVSLQSKYINRVIVSTDDEKITEVSKRYGAEVLKRSTELSQDSTPTIDVVFHVLDELKKDGYNPDIIILLQPTSPLRTVDDVDKSIELFAKLKSAQSLVSVTAFSHSPFWAIKIENNFLKSVFGKKYFLMRGQDLSTLFRPNGAIFISKPNILRKYKTFYAPKAVAYKMPPERSIDIDDITDLKLAEFLMKK
jgi:CMP-N-acetylneuraminic acid synthetase